jgi:serine/threonine protein kinase/WD40 repeat protein
VTDESIFAAALAIPSPADRAAFLDRACAGQPDLRRLVEQLLTAHAADNPLDRPPPDLGLTGPHHPRPDDLPAAAIGDRIGPYRLMEQIGEGGFGLVFVAEQTEPVRRKVALKVIKPGMDTRDVVARFEAERQALALMDHPNIAKVLDAGSTPAGRPFFVMELVRGVPITEFCDANKLSPRDRLALFVQVCHAVQHAHQKGVIHRDLKPSNVLVTSHDGVPVPKVIDFGVAKAVGQSLTEKTIYTRFTQMIGTPLYMSPEQAEMSGLDVDTRADVYALGVLLYELLTGTTPFDRDRFRQAAFDEIRRIIREEEPPRPSTRLSSLGATLQAVSASRGTDPSRLAGVVRGELDWIVMRCLEKDRVRRYETANGLARDVQRHLAGEAVEACPPTLGYRLRRFCRKYGAAIATVLLIVGILKGVTAFSIWQMSRATVAEAIAATERDEAVAAREVAATERDNVARANESLRRLAAERRQTLYATSMNLAQAAWETGDPGRTFELLRQQVPKPGEDDLRGFEWHYWNRFAHQDSRTVRLEGFGDSSAGGRWANSSPDGTRIAAFITDPAGSSALKLWDADTGKEIWSARVAPDTGSYWFSTFSRDGRRLVTCRNLEPREERRRSNLSELRVWDTVTGKAVYSSDSRDGSRMFHPVLSPDGSRIAVRVNGPRPSYSSWLSVRRLPGGEEVFRYPPDDSRVMVAYSTFSPDGQRIAAITLDPEQSRSRTLVLWGWDADGELEQDTVTLPGTRYLAPCFSPDGARIAAPILDGPSDQIILWDSASLKELQVLTLPAASRPSTAFYPIVFAPDGKKLAVQHGAQVHLFDVDPGRTGKADPLLRTFRGHESRVRDLAFNANGSRLVTLDEEGTVKQRDPAPRERSVRTPFTSSSLGRRSILPNADGSRIAFVPDPPDLDRRVRVVNGRCRLTDGAGRPVGDSVLPEGRSRGQAFSLDGRTFALVWHTYADDGTLLLIQDAVTGKEIRRLVPPRGQGLEIINLSPDGSRVVALYSASGSGDPPNVETLTIWETATGREVLSRRTPYHWTPVYSPDGRWLVLGDGSSGPDDRIVWLDARTGEEAAAVPVRKGHLGRPDRIIFSRDGRQMATHAIGGPSSVLVWDVAPILRGEVVRPVASLTGHGGEITYAEFSPDGRRVLTAGGGKVKLWDVVSGREVLTLEASGAAVGAAYFSPDGHTIWGGLDEDGRLWGWDGTPLPEEKTP